MDGTAGQGSYGNKALEETGLNRDERGKNNPQSLVSLIECPVCFDISLPIFQCTHGHIICKVCWESLSVKICPSCRVLMNEPTRNRALEQIIQNFDARLACKFAANGCPEMMLFPQKEAHQVICNFRNYDCPLSVSGCRWVGRLGDIVQHLKGRKRSSHSLPVLYGESATFFFTIDPEMEGHAHVAIQIQSCLDSFFVVAFRTRYYNRGEGDSAEGNVEYSALVQHVGLKDETRQFAYRMELERDGRRLSWEAVPIPMSEEIKPSLDRGDCLNFNSKTMLLFKSEDADMIPIDVTISKI